jgi:hypothetical protein
MRGILEGGFGGQSAPGGSGRGFAGVVKRVGSVQMRDCTTWAHPHQNPDTVQVEADAHAICVKVERISLGTPLDPWQVGLATDTGDFS